MYKKIIYLFAMVTIVTIAFLINGCNDSVITPPGSQNSPLMTAGNGCDTPNTFCGSPGTVLIQNPCPGTVQTIDLWAGVGNPAAGVLVGHVEFTFVSGTTWHVKYVFTNSSFEASVVHFAIACSLAGIPQTKNHNPIPGQFQYSKNSAPWEFNINLPSGCSCFYVAAHAGGTLGGVDCFNVSIPAGCVNLSDVHHDFEFPASDTACYWNFTLSNAGSFNGRYCGWCMDLGTEMGTSIYNCAHIFSSLAPFPDYLKPLIEGWANMDKVNYLLNHFHSGQTVQLKDISCNDSDGTDILTAMDIQKAIWLLLDVGAGNLRPEWEALSTSGRRMAILCDVNANGGGFVPSCTNGDVIAFIIDPGNNPDQTQAQPILGAAPCCNGQGVTAWGDGKYGGNFSGPNWATYFKWCPTCP